MQNKRAKASRASSARLSHDNQVTEFEESLGKHGVAAISIAVLRRGGAAVTAPADSQGGRGRARTRIRWFHEFQFCKHLRATGCAAERQDTERAVCDAELQCQRVVSMLA